MVNLTSQADYENLSVKHPKVFRPVLKALKTAYPQEDETQLVQRILELHKRADVDTRYRMEKGIASSNDYQSEFEQAVITDMWPMIDPWMRSALESAHADEVKHNQKRISQGLSEGPAVLPPEKMLAMALNKVDKVVRESVYKTGK